MMKSKDEQLEEIMNIDDFAEDGVFCVPIKEPLGFDLRKACAYANANNGGIISEEIVKMFSKK